MNLLNTNQQLPKPVNSSDKTGVGISPYPFGGCALNPEKGAAVRLQ